MAKEHDQRVDALCLVAATSFEDRLMQDLPEEYPAPVILRYRPVVEIALGLVFNRFLLVMALRRGGGGGHYAPAGATLQLVQTKRGRPLRNGPDVCLGQPARSTP